MEHALSHFAVKHVALEDWSPALALVCLLPSLLKLWAMSALGNVL